MRMDVGFRFLTLALVLLLVAPAVPLHASAVDDAAEGAAAGAATDEAVIDEPWPPVDSTPEAQAQVLPIDPAFCVPIERGMQSPATPVADASPVAAADRAMWDYTEGVPADAATFWRLVNSAVAFLACSNAGDADAARTRVTDTYLRTHVPPQGRVTAAAGEVPEDRWLTITYVDDVRMHGVDRGVVFLAIGDPGHCSWDVSLAVALREVNGVWLVDGIADVSGVEPSAYTPPIFRAANVRACWAGE